MRIVIEKILASSAARLIARHKPEIVAITGSVGKSSAKDAVATVLNGRFDVRATPRNLNTEIGLPLTVLGLPEGGSSALKWAGILPRAIMRSFSGGLYPKTLVLEMGLQHPGDIAKLCDIAPPSIGIVTAIGESHVEFMGSVDAIQKEKRVIVERLPKEGHAVLNRDDDRVWAMRTKTKAQIVSFGYHEESTFRALPDSVSYACGFDRECGTHVKISVNGSAVPFFLSDVLGRHGVYAALAAAAVGTVKGMNLVDISEAMRGYRPPPGRMRHLAGIKRTVLIDDTYNASPRSTKAALDVLGEMPLPEGAKRIAVLGDMLELGTGTEEGHREVGMHAADKADLLIFVGERMSIAELGALSAGVPSDRIFHFPDADAAKMFVQERMKQNDVVLIKGSRGMRMERVVKEIMADPLDADRLLVAHVE